MSDIIQSDKDKIISHFDSSTGDYWKTLDEISSETKLAPNIVLKIITNSGDFVRSSYRKKVGEPLFTSRKMFRNKAPIMDKIIGTFKNRID